MEWHRIMSVSIAKMKTPFFLTLFLIGSAIFYVYSYISDGILSSILSLELAHGLLSLLKDMGVSKPISVVGLEIWFNISTMVLLMLVVYLKGAVIIHASSDKGFMDKLKELRPRTYLRLLLIVLLVALLFLDIFPYQKALSYAPGGEKYDFYLEGVLQMAYEGKMPSFLPHTIFKRALNLGLPLLPLARPYTDYCLLSSDACLYALPFQVPFFILLFVGLFFLFAQQEVVVNGSMIVDALRNSVFLVKRKFMDVCILWILCSLILILSLGGLSLIGQLLAPDLGRVLISAGYSLSILAIILVESVFYDEIREQIWVHKIQRADIKAAPVSVKPPTEATA